MNKPQIFKRITASVMATVLLLQPLSFSTIAIAANHPLTQISTDGPELQTLDYVINTDWDDDAAEPHVVSGVRPDETVATEHTLNRAYITQVIRAFAKTNYTMTEGRHRIGTVYVYRNSLFGNNVDIRLLSAKPGRSNASVSGLGKHGKTSNNYVLDATSGNAPETVLGLGQVVAHEKGHYTYGVYDEYEGSAGSNSDLGSPRKGDTALATLMHDQYRFPSFSTQDQYTSATRTAQGRAFNNLSVWEALASNPSRDPEYVRQDERTFFSVFATNVPKTRTDLKRPTDGWDAKLNIVYVPNPGNFTYVLISRALVGKQLEAAKDAAAQAVRALPLSATNFVAIGAYPGRVATPVVAKTALTTSLVRDSVLAEIEAITSEASPGDFNAALSTVLEQVQSARAANGLSTSDIVNISTLVNSSDDNSITKAVLERVRAERVSVRAVAGTFAADSVGTSSSRSMAKAERGVSLAALATASGGSLALANKPAEMVKATMASSKEGIGKGLAELGYAESEKLAAGASFTLSSKVASGIDETLEVAVIWESANDTGKLKLSLKAPNGQFMRVTDIKQDQDFGNGVTYEIDLESNTALFNVAAGYTGLGGLWESTVMANAAMTGGLLQEALAESKVQISASVIADETAKPILHVTLGSDQAVVGAAVTAKVMDANGTTVRTVVLRDDGTNGDSKANDGVYSVALSGLLPAGVYEFEIDAGQPGTGRARFSLNGLTKNGAPVAEEVIESDFTRSVVAVVTVGNSSETGTGGGGGNVVTGASSGGGCTVGNGTDSSLLLMLAAAALWLSRRKLIIRLR